MSARWRVLALMTSAQAGASVFQQGLGSIAPVLVATFALSKAQLGVAFTAMSIGAMLFTTPAGVFTDRWGERRMVLLSGIVMTAALLAATAVRSYGWLVAAIGVFGAGYAASTPAGGRAVLAWFDRDRGLAMGIRQTGVPLGALIGALTLPIVAGFSGYRGAFAYGAVMAAVPTAIAYAGYREQRDDTVPAATLSSVTRGMRALVRDSRLLAVTATCIILVCTQSAMNAFLTLTAVAVVGTSVKTAAIAFAAAHAAATLGRLGWGYASDRMLGGERLIPLAIICVTAACATLAFALLRHGAIVQLFLASVLLGCSGAGWNGLFAAALAEVGGPERAASALGLGLTAIFGASAIAPTAFGVLADATSLHVAWGCIAALALTGVVPVLWLRARAHR
ncbi:MAG: MFS transporter [Candidatus Elarobacter sp.]